jgi:hypothetical protein
MQSYSNSRLNGKNRNHPVAAKPGEKEKKYNNFVILLSYAQYKS